MNASGHVSREPRTRLGGNDIGRCLTRLHHDRFTAAEPIDDPVRQRTFDRGFAHEDEINRQLMALQPRTVVISQDLSWSAAIDTTMSEMESGSPLIIGGRISNADGSLVGAPDVLVRRAGGYAAVEIKSHKVVGKSGPEATRSPLSHLHDHSGELVRFRSARRRDLLQVAHYWRILDEIGLGTPETLGGVIGTDDPASCLWVDLAAGSPPILDEHETWLIEGRAVLEHGRQHPERPLVDPWMRGECQTCNWHDLCLGDLIHLDDPTLLRGVDAEMRNALIGDGIRTVADVAGLSLDDARMADNATVVQARARTYGGLMRRTPDGVPIDLPRRRIEVDFDIETSGGTIYLAGLLISEEDGEPRYEPIADWTGTPDGERQVLEHLFERFATWSDDDVVVFHWTDYEPRTLTEAALRHDLTIDGSSSIEEWFANHAFDLCAWSRAHLASPDGHGLKVIAPLCGFSWRDDDPGGLQSEMWFEDLLAGDVDMRQRLLAYNEDDVVAQAEIRRWVKGHDDGRGPGTAIPSVTIWPPPAVPLRS